MSDTGSKGERKYSPPENRKVRWERVLEEGKGSQGHSPSQGEMNNYPPSYLRTGHSLKKVT